MCYSRDYYRMIEAKKAEEARMEQQRRAEQIDKMLEEATSKPSSRKKLRPSRMSRRRNSARCVPTVAACSNGTSQPAVS